MSQSPEEFIYREYNGQSSEGDYAHPDYYRQKAPERDHGVQPFDPYAADVPYHDVDPVLNPYDQLHEYRSPQSLEGYTMQPGVEPQAPEANIEISERPKNRKGLAGIGGTIAAIVAWLVKLKGLAFLLKFGWAGVTALISIGAYALLFGWRFAIGLVALLFIHEMGHALVMKLKGIPMGGMIFIPLLGAAVIMRRMPQNARDEAEVGIAGPVAGAIASSFCLLAAYMPMADSIWAPLAYFGFFINLFNLIPIIPFDGGRIVAAIDRRFWIIGLLGLLGFQIWDWLHGSFSIWLLFFVVIAATQLWSRGAATKAPGAQSYYRVPVLSRIVLSLLYFGLAAVLFLGISAALGLMPGIQ